MVKLNKKGFTLAELLIVVAIIAVLVAVSIPVFNTQLERSREAADMSNLRAAYSAATVYLMGHPESTATSLYYDPGIDGNITTSGGAEIGRKASMPGQQSGEMSYAFNTNYQFGPMDSTGGATANKPSETATIQIDVDPVDRNITCVSFADDSAPFTVVWKDDKNTLPARRVSGQKGETFTAVDLTTLIDVKSFGTAATASKYEDADNRLSGFGMAISEAGSISATTDNKPTAATSGLEKVRIKVTSATINNATYVKYIEVPISIEPAA